MDADANGEFRLLSKQKLTSFIDSAVGFPSPSGRGCRREGGAGEGIWRSPNRGCIRTYPLYIRRMPCVFCRIINREIPAKIFYETDEVIVIADHRPKDKVHLLIFPKVEHQNFYKTPPDVLAMMNQTVKTVVEKLGIKDHFRLVINNGYGQEVDHIHFHILSNRGEESLTFLP